MKKGLSLKRIKDKVKVLRKCLIEDECPIDNKGNKKLPKWLILTEKDVVQPTEVNKERVTDYECSVRLSYSVVDDNVWENLLALALFSKEASDKAVVTDANITVERGLNDFDEFGEFERIKTLEIAATYRIIKEKKRKKKK